MNEENVSIEQLFNRLSEKYEVKLQKDYEVIYPESYEIKVLSGKYVKLVAVSRHKTSKHLVKIGVVCDKTTGNTNSIGTTLKQSYEVTVTTDHVCMRYDRDHFFENVDAKQLRVNDYVSVYDETDNTEHIGCIVSIEDIGTTDEWVYDCEVDDRHHAFYADNVLVHNSQFVHIQCVTDDFKKKYSLNEDLSKWDDEHKLMLWKWMDDFVENEVNPYVQNDLIGKTYHTEHPEVLRYSLEYIGATGIYEKKKHYAVRKIISEGPELVDKVKFSGIELKKASSPAAVKDILRDIYFGVLKENWNEHTFVGYVNKAYDEFKTLSIDDIAMWKGYNTARESSGFLQMELGATGISKACTYYNQMIKHLKIGRKYDSILLGQKIRFTYIIPSNEYGIECIAFHDGQWPKEFNQIFKVDYDVMFDKLVLSPLKGFLAATKFKKVDPRKQVVFDVFDL
jgi:hypothetical protein